MNKYFIEFYYNSNYNAGSKARDDIAYFLKSKKFSPVMLAKKNSKIKNILNIYNIIKKINKIQVGSEVLIQYPFTDTKVYNPLIIYLLKKKRCKCILLIHDVPSLRFRWSNDKVEKEIDYMNKFDFIISHNKKMSEWLRKKGLQKEIINLELFDYIVKSYKAKEYVNDNSIVFAGNLSENKSGFIYNLDSNIKEEIKVNLYGVGLDTKKALVNSSYMGKYDPDELPNKLEGKYGLIWDGASISECSGDFGEYLKYNNPHKFSLYLSADLPVIVWSKSAIADFVRENNVGIAIDTLVNLEEILKKVSYDEYNVMKKNASKIGELVRNGEYIKRALKKV
jgi:hypothetical protein